MNAASLLSLLTLGAEFGDSVTLYAEGEGAEAALDELAAMLGRDLDEELKLGGREVRARQDLCSRSH